MPESHTRPNKRPSPAQQASSMTPTANSGIFTIADLLGSPTPTLSSAGSSHIDVPTSLFGAPHSHADSNVFSSDELARLPVFNSITLPRWPTVDDITGQASFHNVGHAGQYYYTSHLSPQPQPQVYQDDYSLKTPFAGYPTVSPDQNPHPQVLRQAPRSPASTTMSDVSLQSQGNSSEMFHSSDGTAVGGELWASVTGGFECVVFCVRHKETDACISYSLDVWNGYLASFDANPFG